MKVQLKPNMIVAGKWAQHAHCNTKANSKGRASWTIYLDWRVFSSKHVHKTPKGFEFWHACFVDALSLNQYLTYLNIASYSCHLTVFIKYY